ncbi:hypothetical protein [Pedobacter rhodius]|uniref:Uncharacterized protein n=1 Tax=Pedobacter rhodius TaxID=3004098 RepID=A0ABT4KUY9_9SPHI|nr:hypothetical protein [Pedobacter sp. SJ11]MCZ4222062.1 hypothetical protein [Pedobacter sp. SJ11]
MPKNRLSLKMTNAIRLVEDAPVSTIHVAYHMRLCYKVDLVGEPPTKELR